MQCWKKVSLGRRFRGQLALVAIEPVGLVAFVYQEAQPGGGGLKYGGVDLGMPLKEPVITTVVTQRAASAWKFGHWRGTSAGA